MTTDLVQITGRYINWDWPQYLALGNTTGVSSHCLDLTPFTTTVLYPVHLCKPWAANSPRSFFASCTYAVLLQALEQTVWVNITVIGIMLLIWEILSLFRCWCIFETTINYSCSKVSSSASVMLMCLVHFPQTVDCLPHVSTALGVPLEVIILNHPLPLLSLGASVSPETPSGAAHVNTQSPAFVRMI